MTNSSEHFVAESGHGMREYRSPMGLLYGTMDFNDQLLNQLGWAAVKHAAVSASFTQTYYSS